MFNPMAVRTGAVYGSLLLMVGVMLPFLPVWLAARGFSIAEVAFALFKKKKATESTTPSNSTVTPINLQMQHASKKQQKNETDRLNDPLGAAAQFLASLIEHRHTDRILCALNTSK